MKTPHVFDQNECIYCRIGIAWQKHGGETCVVRSRILKQVDNLIRSELLEAVFLKNNPKAKRSSLREDGS